MYRHVVKLPHIFDFQSQVFILGNFLCLSLGRLWVKGTALSISSAVLVSLSIKSTAIYRSIRYDRPDPTQNHVSCLQHRFCLVSTVRRDMKIWRCVGELFLPVVVVGSAVDDGR